MTSNVTILPKIRLNVTPDGAQKLKDFIIQVNFFKQISHKFITLPKKSLKNWFTFSLFGKGAVGWFLNPKKNYGSFLLIDKK